MKSVKVEVVVVEGTHMRTKLPVDCVTRENILCALEIT